MGSLSGSFVFSKKNVSGSMCFRHSRRRGESFGTGSNGATRSGHIKRLGTGAPSNTAHNNQPRWLDFRGALQAEAVYRAAGRKVIAIFAIDLSCVHMGKLALSGFLMCPPKTGKSNMPLTHYSCEHDPIHIFQTAGTRIVFLVYPTPICGCPNCALRLCAPAFGR